MNRHLRTRWYAILKVTEWEFGLDEKLCCAVKVVTPDRLNHGPLYVCTINNIPQRNMIPGIPIPTYRGYRHVNRTLEAMMLVAIIALARG